MRARAAFMLTLLSLLSFILSACGSAPSASSTTAPAAQTGTGQSVSFWMKKSLVDASNDAITARVKQFEQQTGITVDLRILPYEDLRTQWSAAIESGNVPDVSFFGYQEVGQYYRQGVLMDVSDVVADVQKTNGPMTEALVDAATFEGRQWGIPFWSESTILFYRKDLFEQAGLGGPPETWEQFRAYAQTLTNPAEGIYGAGLGLGRANSDAEFWFRDILWSSGAYEFSADGTAAALDTPEAKAAFQWMADFFTKDGVVPPGAVGWDDSGNNKAYLAGQAAMVINVGSVYYVLNRDNPDLLENTGFALVPGGPEGRFIVGISNNLGIFSKAKNPVAAKQLIAFLEDAEWQKTAWVPASGYQVVPVYPALAEDEFWNTEAGKVFTETPKHYKFLGEPGPFTPAAGEVFNSRLMTDALEQIVVNNKPVDQAVTDLNSAIAEVIAKYK